MMIVHHEDALVTAHGAEGAWGDHCAAVPRRDAAGRHGVGEGAPMQDARLIAIEMVHGAAGSTTFGAKMNMWAPAATGSAFDLSPTAMASLEPYRKHLTIVSNTDCRNAEAFSAPEIGADHFRSAAVFLTQSKPKQTQGSDVLRRHVARPGVRAAVRPGHADSVDAALHRERRPGRRLLLQLLVRLHRLDQLGVADRAAADDSRPAGRVRPAVRRGHHARGAQAPAAATTRASSTSSPSRSAS